MGKELRWEFEFCGRSLRTEDGSFDMIYMARGTWHVWLMVITCLDVVTIL